MREDIKMNRTERRKQERIEKKRLKKAQKQMPVFMPSYDDINRLAPKTSVSDKNKKIVDKLNDPKSGFDVLAHWKVDNTKWGASGVVETIIYTPELDNDDWSETEFEHHISVYVDAFGGVESSVFNVMHEFEHKGSLNPYTGNKTFEPFDDGSYKLNIGVYTDEEGKVSIFPILQNGHELKEQEFQRPYSGSSILDPIFSQLAKANFSTVYTSEFNTDREKNVDALLSGGWGRLRYSDVARANWLDTYEVSYHAGRSLMADKSEGLIWVTGPEPTSKNKVDFYGVTN